jgi:hypothetical protein
MTLLASWDLSEETEFRKRVDIAGRKAAVDVQAEDPAGLSIPVGYVGVEADLHLERSQYAAVVLQGGQVETIARAVATNGALTAASTDSDIEFTVNSMWNALAVNRAA